MIVKPGHILITDDKIEVVGFHYDFNGGGSSEDDIREWIIKRLNETMEWSLKDTMKKYNPTIS